MLRYISKSADFPISALQRPSLVAWLTISVLTGALSGCGGGADSATAATINPAPEVPVSETPVPDTPIADPSSNEIAAASRFTAQASFGLPYGEIVAVAAEGHSKWLDDQFALPTTRHTPLVLELLERRNNGEFNDIEDDVELLISFRRYSWWHNTITAPDQVRQRVALALSEIMVVSDRVDALLLSPLALSTYYDALLEGAFGNFRDLIAQVALHPAMGFYLSHVNNAKTDLANNTFPDENFAREVMQLFSIGLFELNNDGSQKTTADGLPIPTYTSDDIREFARIFTGLSWGGDGAFFGNPEPVFHEPMLMFDEFHETGEKRLLNGQIVPSGQTGLEDIQSALDNLFNHPSTGPFISRQLIQRLVTSNPSPGYVSRVASTFNDNGSNIRGDMRSVIQAILLDPEAITPPDPVSSGKLREPLVRNVAFLRQLNPESTDGRFFNSGFFSEALTTQGPLSAPSVFNFFLPDHVPSGALSTAGLFAPEFQITNSTTIAGITNLVDIAVNGGFSVDAQPPFGAVTLNLSEFETLAASPAELVQRLDLTFTYGEMSQGTKDLIVEVLNDLDDMNLRAKTALYIVLTSPDYAVRV